MSAKREFRNDRSKVGGRAAPSPSAGLRLLDRDSGDGSTLWSHGPASQFVVAKQYMEVRAKQAGVWELWTGDESSEFTLPRPSVSYKFDADYAEPSVIADSAEGKKMVSSSARTPGDPTTGTPATPGTPVYRCSGNMLSEHDPLYTPRRGEVCDISEMAYGKIVRMTSDYDKMSSHVDKVMALLLKWTSALRDHKRRLGVADATMMACLGPSAQAVVKKLLRDGDISGAWAALSDKYAPAQNSDVIRQLVKHIHSLRMKGPTRLEEYLGSLDTLQDALGESGAQIEEPEMLAVVKDAVLDSPGGIEAYGAAFKNARQMGWGLGRLTGVLVSDCHELVQAAGIAELKNADFHKEMVRRKITPAVPARTEPRGSDVAPYAGGAAVAVAGTDGKIWDTTKCYKCNDYGHLARFCPSTAKPSRPTAANAKFKGEDAPDAPDAPEPKGKGSGGGDKAAKQAKPPANPTAAAAGGRASATGKFFMEEDDDYASDASSENGNAGACMSCAEGVVLFPNGMGDPARRA
jgi:hypothetical protein